LKIKFTIPKPRFFLFGAYGRRNTGDDAMLYALLRELSVANSDASFAVLAQNPIIVPNEVESDIHFVKPIIPIVLKEILNSSVFMIGGGTHFHDYGSNKLRWNKVIFKILTLILLSKIFRKYVFLVAIGVGPITNFLGKIQVKLICVLSDFISVRDKASYKVIRSLGVKKDVLLTFDPAVLLEPMFNTNPTKKTKDRKILGVSILPVFKLFFETEEMDLLLIKEIAVGLNDWLKEDLQNVIHIFVFNDEPKGGDLAISKLLYERLQPSRRVKLIPYDTSPIMVLSRIAKCYAFVGMRFHSCIFAYQNNIPLLMIEYHPKCSAVAETIGLPNHAVISLNEIISGKFKEYIKNLQRRPDSFVASIPVEITRQMSKLNLPQNKTCV